MGQPPADQPISQSTPLRGIVATVLINGVPTQVAMQVVSLSDSDGHTIDLAQQTLVDVMLQLLKEQRVANQMLSTLSGVPYVPTADAITTFGV